MFCSKCGGRVISGIDHRCPKKEGNQIRTNGGKRDKGQRPPPIINVRR